jgi:hypothetical protein
MPNKFVGAFKFLTQGARKGKVAPTITQPRQLKTTMKRIQSENKRFGFTKAKTATDRANIVRRKKSIERMDKLEKAKSKVKTGEKGKKEIQKLVDTGQADRVGSSVYHRGIRDKKAEGGILGRAKKFLGKETPKRKPKSEAEINKITSSDAYKKADYKTKTKMLGGQVFTRKEMEEKIKKGKPGIKEKILPQKKKDRLQELRKELGMKKGGRAKKFPDLTGDGKVTQADILKGRGVFGVGGGVRGSTKGSDIYSRLKQKDRLKKIRKMFKGKK